MLAVRSGCGQIGRWRRGSIKRTFVTGREDTTTIDGQKIGFKVVGDGSHKVLFLPGALGSYETDFQPQLDGLDRQRFTLVGWDPPGYGRSRPPDRDFRGNFYRRDADFAHKLMQELGFGSSYSLVGWSDGGITALIQAAKYAQAINRLVVFGASAYVTKKDVELCDAIADLSKWSDRMRAPFVAMYGEEYFRKLWAEWIEAWRRFYTDNPHGDLCTGDIKSIRCPTLIIHGLRDPLVPEEHCHYLTKNIADSELIIMAQGKHNLHLKYADKFNTMVQHFLSKPLH